MLRISILLFFLCGYLESSSQTLFIDDNVASTSELYTAIVTQLIIGSEQRFTTEDFLIEKPKWLDIELPNEIDTVVLKYVDRGQLKKMTSGKNTVLLHRLIPVRLDSEGFFVSIVFFEVSRKGKKFNYVNQGGLRWYINSD